MSQNIHQSTNTELITTPTGESPRTQFSIKVTVQRGGITQREINMFTAKIEDAATMWKGGNVKYEMG